MLDEPNPDLVAPQGTTPLPERTEPEQDGHRVQVNGVHVRWRFHVTNTEELSAQIERTYWQLVGGEEASKNTSFDFEVSMDPHIIASDGQVKVWECQLAGQIGLKLAPVAPPAEDQNIIKPHPGSVAANRAARRKKGRK